MKTRAVPKGAIGLATVGALVFFLPLGLLVGPGMLVGALVWAIRGGK